MLFRDDHPASGAVTGYKEQCKGLMNRHFDKCGLDASMSNVVKISEREKGDKLLYKDPIVVPIYNICLTEFTKLKN